MPVKSEVALGTLGYIIVYVKDTEKAVPFYQETLGLKVRSNEPGWVEFDTGSTVFALHSNHELPDAADRLKGQATPVFNAERFYETYEALKRAGVRFETTPQQVCEIGPDKIGMCAEFRDPEGNPISMFGIVSK